MPKSRRNVEQQNRANQMSTRIKKIHCADFLASKNIILWSLREKQYRGAAIPVRHSRVEHRDATSLCICGIGMLGLAFRNFLQFSGS